MTKNDLLKQLKDLEEVKRIHIDGINANSNKNTIQNAIDCLNCSDEILDKYLIVVSLKYENIGRTVAQNGDFKRHAHNRLYIYNTARQILAQ